MIDLSDIVNDSDLGSEFIIERSTGDWASGGWTVKNVTNLVAFGPVRTTAGKEIEQLPEADRIGELRTFRACQPMYVTAAQGMQTSDVLIWGGDRWRVINAKNYASTGYYFAIASRQAGQ